MPNNISNHKDLFDRTYENGKRIAVVESKLDDIKDNLHDIKNNDLYHLKKKVDRINWWLVLLLGGVASSLAIQLIQG